MADNRSVRTAGFRSGEICIRHSLDQRIHVVEGVAGVLASPTIDRMNCLRYVNISAAVLV